MCWAKLYFRILPVIDLKMKLYFQRFSYSRHYHYEHPWPSAQAEIRRLAAYKTPQDKVACVVRCSQTIMNLLSLASSKSVPAADDFVPVMVFVIIKANPPSLLSTVQVGLKLLTFFAMV